MNWHQHLSWLIEYTPEWARLNNTRAGGSAAALRQITRGYIHRHLSARVVADDQLSPVEVSVIDICIVGATFVADRPLANLDDKLRVDTDWGHDTCRELPCRLRLVLGSIHPGLAEPLWHNGVLFSGLNDHTRRLIQHFATERGSPLN